MRDSLSPSVGWGVLHLFCSVGFGADASAVATAVKACEAANHQVVSFTVFGHKADVGFMAIGPDWVTLRQLQTGLQAAGLEIRDSYLSLTEVSEYAAGMPEEHLQARLYPTLPPEGKRAICFYPMSKRRGDKDNWYSLEFEQRKRLMMDHGKSGRRFAGRIVQLITGSTGLDDFEWGVTLFGVHPDDLKDTVYTMRFDEASALYAEFGPFYAGVVGTVDEVMAEAGVTPQ
ncbi:MAG TPA: chlorite dismutase family protein [Acidimicrobiales bacterium]|jgi:chlorite dismutase|nr:chlorite dismutase family protein [Acidimicrobiales bacterium]